MRLSFVSACLLAALALPGAAYADPMGANPILDVFTLSYGGQTLTIDFPANPTPASYGLGYNFTVDGTAVFSTGATCADGMEFYTYPTGGGGFADSCILGLAPYTDQGVQMFSGPVTDPTFIPGTYDFNTESGSGALTISQTPEPPSLLLLGTGLVGMAGLVGLRFRRKG